MPGWFDPLQGALLLRILIRDALLAVIAVLAIASLKMSWRRWWRGSHASS